MQEERAKGKGKEKWIHMDEGRGRESGEREKKKRANFPAGMEQKRHAVLNGYPDSETHSEAG